MKKAVLVDLHGTLFNKDDEHPEDIIIQTVNGLAKHYAVLVFTARNIANEDKETAKILKAGIKYTDFYYLNEDEGDVDKKLEMLETIQTKYKICLLIDNNKQVCKAFHKIGIDYLRFKEGELT